jgi:hypothetical protein
MLAIAATCTPHSTVEPIRNSRSNLAFLQNNDPVTVVSRVGQLVQHQPLGCTASEKSLTNLLMAQKESQRRVWLAVEQNNVRSAARKVPEANHDCAPILVPTTTAQMQCRQSFGQI